MRLKRWESPRREGRNDHGKGGAARQRQLKKREKLLRKLLKSQENKRREIFPPFIFVYNYCLVGRKMRKIKIDNFLILDH
jgi:hypothetical protein